MQAVYVPADDPTDPAPANAFAHLDAFIYLERSIASKGIYPAVDPLASASRALDPQIVGEEHYRVARKVQNMLQRYRDLQDIIAILGVDELSEEDKLIVGRAPKDRAIFQSAVFRCRAVHGQERHLLRRSPTRSRASTTSATAKRTICPNRRFCMWARWMMCERGRRKSLSKAVGIRSVRNHWPYRMRDARIKDRARIFLSVPFLVPSGFPGSNARRRGLFERGWLAC